MQVAQRQGGRWGNRRGSSEVSVASRGGCMEQREGEARRTLDREQTAVGGGREQGGVSWDGGGDLEIIGSRRTQVH